ncbi:GntR family transcriptional regulator [Paenibacillus sabinae]|uniref:GntR family transcriptional regulator n=1 Tax=Paenibacillus sabinae T27 TaxID=1268072 RepID=X4ZC64_9BACL|nr:GntR family transcriptional regulator [Paenibacillus sabinae]AHV95117.1 GntR family transcriptional regulator [Paenibacillus sabinae T27]
MNLSRNKRPLYQQIKNIIKDRILHGLYPLETNIPSEPLLEEEFGVSKITVRNAIKELVQEGYLETSSGKGTKVIRNTSTSKRSTWKRFTEVLVEEGHVIHKVLLGAESVTHEEGSKPHSLFGTSGLRIERLYVLDDSPYIHYTHYFPAWIGGVDPAELDAQSLYGWMEERKVTIAKFRDEFGVAPPPPGVEALLKSGKGMPLLKRYRYAYDESGSVVEYSEGYYRSELQPYVVNYDV